MASSMEEKKQQRTPLSLALQAFQRFKLPSFETRSHPPNSYGARNLGRGRPLLDLEDVRAFLRSALGKHRSSEELPISPPPPPSSASFTHSTKHSHESSHNLPGSVSDFDIGVIGPSLSDHPSSSDRAEVREGQDGHLPSHRHSFSNRQDWQETTSNIQDGQPPPYRPDWRASTDSHFVPQEEQGRSLLDIEDAREAIQRVAEFCGTIQRLGLPETSWQNKMPWHVPRAPFLAKGLQWPPESFDSEEQRKEFYRKARERKPFMFGAPPTWSFMVVNVAFLSFLIFNPLAKFFPL